MKKSLSVGAGILKKKLLPDEDGRNGAMSYAAWLETYGTDPDEAYRVAVSDAEEARARDSAGGRTGEALARGMLARSGYADYLRAAREDAYAQSKAAASDALSRETAASRQAYRRYLSDWNTAQSKLLTQTMAKMVKLKFADHESAYEYAVASGLSSERATAAARFALTAGADSDVSIEKRFSMLKEIMRYGMSSEGAYRLARAMGMSDTASKEFAAYADAVWKGKQGSSLSGEQSAEDAFRDTFQ